MIKYVLLSDHRLDFSALSADEVDTLKLRYDLGSVMHYSQRTFAKDPHKPTFTLSQVNENFPESNIGQRTNLSPIDIAKIKTLYQCRK